MSGRAWTSGPGGILVISPEGKLLAFSTPARPPTVPGAMTVAPLHHRDGEIIRIQTLSHETRWPR
jgi:hypothetical protein